MGYFPNKMSNVLTGVPSEKHYAILSIGKYTKTIDYGPPDQPYDETCEYRRYEYYADKSCLHRAIQHMIKDGKEPGYDFLVLEVYPLTVKSEFVVTIDDAQGKK